MFTWIETYLPNVYKMGWTGQAGWWTAIQVTLGLTAISFLIGGLLGLIGGLVLVMCGPGGVRENKWIATVVDKVTSIFRAIPFVILIAFLTGFTFLMMKTTIGPKAAIPPLVVATFAFFCRQVQVVFSEMDKGIIEAAQASGATTWDIVVVYLRECLPDLIRVSTVTLISIVGETTMASIIGAGGLGNVAIAYGYQRYNTDVTLTATLIILLIIFSIQFLGDWLIRKVSHR